MHPPPNLQGDGPVHLAPRVDVPAGVLRWAFSRSGGPGGQNVNKVNTKAELRIRLLDLPVSEGARARLASALGKRLSAEGDAVIVSQSERSQQANKEECLDRLRALVLAALTPPTPRRATKPTRSSKVRRLNAKRRRGDVKRGRGGGGGAGGGGGGGDE